MIHLVRFSAIEKLFCYCCYYCISCYNQPIRKGVNKNLYLPIITKVGHLFQISKWQVSVLILSGESLI